MSEKTKAPQDFDPQQWDEEEANVSPQEQAQYDTVVGKAMELLYDEDRIGVLVEKLKGGAKNISKEIGHSAAMTLTTIYQSVAEGDGQIPEEILFNAGAEIVSQIVDIAVAAGIVAPEQEQDVAEAALYEGLRIWGQNMGRDGKLSDDMAIKAKESLDMAGIQQDRASVPGRAQEQPSGPQSAPEGGSPQPSPEAIVSGQPGAMPAQQQGIINQAGA